MSTVAEPVAVDAAAPKALKHLSFVNDTAGYAAAAATTVEGAYKRARSFTPASVEPYVAKVEDTVVAYAAPVLATAQDTGGKLLHTADEEVGYVVNATSGIVSKGKEAVSSTLTTAKELHESNLKTFKNATEKYFDFVAKTSDWAADKLNPAKNVQIAREALHATIAKAKELTDPDAAVKAVHEAWESFASIPAVSKVLATVDPVTQRGLSSFNAMHKNVVASSYYKRAVDTTVSTASWYTTTTPYKVSGKFLYPWVKPLAEPAMEKLSKSEAVSSLVTYWAPTTPAATAAAS